MSKVKTGVALIGNEAIRLYRRDVGDADMALRIEAGTNATLRESEDGGRTYLMVKDMGGADIHFLPIRNKDGRITGIEIVLDGYEELEALRRTLRFAETILNYQRLELED